MGCKLFTKKEKIWRGSSTRVTIERTNALWPTPKLTDGLKYNERTRPPNKFNPMYLPLRRNDATTNWTQHFLLQSQRMSWEEGVVNLSSSFECGVINNFDMMYLCGNILDFSNDARLISKGSLICIFLSLYSWTSSKNWSLAALVRVKRPLALIV